MVEILHHYSLDIDNRGLNVGKLLRKKILELKGLLQEKNY